MNGFRTFTASVVVAALAASSYAIGNPPVHFTENRGQWDERVLFKAESAGGLTWFIERDGFTLLQTLPEACQLV